MTLRLAWWQNPDDAPDLAEQEWMRRENERTARPDDTYTAKDAA